MIIFIICSISIACDLLSFVVCFVTSTLLKYNSMGRSQDGRTAWKFFVCLPSMKSSQTNTKPSYTPRKPVGRLTQQSAQPEPQNSAGTRHKELNLESQKPRMVANPFGGRREDGDWGGRGAYWQSTPPQKQLEIKWKIGNSRRD